MIGASNSQLHLMSYYNPPGGRGNGSGYGSTHHSPSASQCSPVNAGGYTATQVSCPQGSMPGAIPGWAATTTSVQSPCDYDDSYCSASVPAPYMNSRPPQPVMPAYQFNYQPPAPVQSPPRKRPERAADCIRPMKFKSHNSAAFASRTERLIFHTPADGRLRTEESRRGVNRSNIQGIYAPGPDKYGMADAIEKKRRANPGPSAGMAPPAARKAAHAPYRPHEQLLNLYATEMADPRSFTRRMAHLANK